MSIQVRVRGVVASLAQAGVVLGVLAAALPVRAHGPNDRPHQLYQIGDLKLESGEVIKDFGISYVTHGTLTRRNRMPS